MFEGKNGKDLFFDEFNRNISHLISDLIRESKLDDRQANNLRNCSRSIRSAAKANRKTSNILAARATLVLANSYILEGYHTLTEYRLKNRFKHANPELVTDLLVEKGNEIQVTEVENGGVAPYISLHPKWHIQEELYHAARLASKIARYSGYSDVFNVGLVAASPINLKLKDVRKCITYFMSDFSSRNQKDTEDIRRLANMLYSEPKITCKQIYNARLDGIFEINSMEHTVRSLNDELFSNGATQPK